MSAIPGAGCPAKWGLYCKDVSKVGCEDLLPTGDTGIEKNIFIGQFPIFIRVSPGLSKKSH